MNSKAYLMSASYNIDSVGNSVASYSRAEILVRQKSITRQEWANSNKVGLKADLVLITPFMNYGGEELIEYEGKTYSIYRTYQAKDDIELYLTRKTGYEESQSEQ